MLLLCHGAGPVRAAEVPPPCAPKILVLRGVFEVFSLGMNDLARKLRCHGYDAEVTSWMLALGRVECCDQRPLVVVGHSLGGRMCAWASRKLKSCGRRVPLIIVVDANLLQRIPPNVDKCLNLYVTNKVGIFHGSPVKPESRCTHIVNWDISQGQPPWYAGGVNHFDIDSTDWVHEIIINEIDAMFRPAASPPLAVVGWNSPPHHPEKAVRTDRVSTVSTAQEPTSGHTPFGDAPGKVTFRVPTRFVAARPAGEEAPRPLVPEPTAGQIVTPASAARLAPGRTPGLRLRFASYIGDESR
jgi:pimeloyl-ACP methyl ester carboxylesterase